MSVIGGDAEIDMDKPLVCFTIEMMAAAGIKKVLIGATPENVVRYRDVVLQSTELEVDVSYLLLDGSEGIARSILAAGEFAAQSNLVVASAGLYCGGADLIPRLHAALGRSKGVTAFRMQGRLSSINRFLPEILVLDARVRNHLRNSNAEHLADITELRKFCAINFSYSECDLGDSCHFVDLVGSVDQDGTITGNADP